MYNLRYHVASLVAVFLALSLGLMLGGITVQSGALGRQRAALVQSLRSDYSKLTKQNADLQGDLELQDDLADSLVAAVTAERLKDVDVLIVANSGQVEGLTDAESAVKEAGGRPVLLTLDRPDLGLEDTATAQALSSMFDGSTGNELREQVARALSAEWASGQAGRVTKALSDAGVLDEGDLPQGKLGGVIDLASFGGQADRGALVLASALDEAGVPAVAAQTRASKAGLATAAARMGLSATDTLGTTTGRYSVVLLLTGAEPGYYGTGSGVVAQFPELPAASR